MRSRSLSSSFVGSVCPMGPIGLLGLLGLIGSIGLLGPRPAPAAEPFSKAAGGQPELVQQGPERAWCPICGMKLRLFYKTSHALRTTDGRQRQYCSLRCLVKDLERLGAAGASAIRVVDAAAGELIDARSAHYVLGSDVPGTMSRRSKLAFADRAAATAFAATRGGRVVSFDRALAAARADLTADDRRLRTKQRLELWPAGERIFRARCRADALSPAAFDSIHRLKAALVREGVCRGLGEPELQRVAHYLWHRRTSATGGQERPAGIAVPERARCPVCGMFVKPYPRWAARVELAGGGRLYFDGAKDMFKFLLQPGRWGHEGAEVGSVQVTGYYDLRPLDGRSARYVIGSDVLGPMGHELVPLPNAERAATFMRDHGGRRSLTFDQVDLELLEQLDRMR
jgi:nitrous oxide reductase accessory protein NosL